MSVNRREMLSASAAAAAVAIFGGGATAEEITTVDSVDTIELAVFADNREIGHLRICAYDARCDCHFGEVWAPYDYRVLKKQPHTSMSVKVNGEQRWIVSQVAFDDYE